MSNSDGMLVWVGDLDDYIDIDQINRWNEQEADEIALREALDDIGELPLLDGRKTSAQALNAKGLTPEEWHWAVSEAEKNLSSCDERADLGPALLRGLLSIGRPYAIGRYARWERLTLASARTAVLPFGHLALIDHQLSILDPASAPDARRAVRAAIKKVEGAGDLTAYERTAKIRQAILDTVDVERAGKAGREILRLILSLTRLRFSAVEMSIRSFDEARALEALYAKARMRAAAIEPAAPGNSQPIRNWTLRHLHPLTFLMPVAVRAALDRGCRHLPPRLTSIRHPEDPPRPRIERVQAVNELALARCATIILGRAARPR